jgi:hypothetical protein
MQKVDLRSNTRARWPLGLFLLSLGALSIDSGHKQQNIATIVWGAGLAVIAIWLLAERRFLLVDTQSGFLSSKRGIFYPFTVASFAIGHVKYIGLDSYMRRSHTSGPARTWYKLVVNGRPDSVLTNIRNEWPARRAGEQLSVALNVPLDNRVHGRHSVRPPNELDMPLAERWRRAGTVHERPSLPAGSRLVVDEIGPNVFVSLPAETSNFKWVALLAVLTGAMAVLFYSTAHGGIRWFLHLFFTTAAVFLAHGLLAFSGRSRVTFSARRVSFRQGWSLFSSSLEFRAIEELIPAGDGIYLVADSREVCIDQPETKADSEFLQAMVAYEVTRRTPVEAADHGPEALR